MFQSLNDLYRRCNCSKTIIGTDIEIYLLPGPAARTVHRASLVTQSQWQGRGGKSFFLLNLRASLKLQLAWAKGGSQIELLHSPGDRVTGGNGSVWVSINFPIFVTLSYDPTISWCQCIRSFEGRAPSVPGKILKKYPSPYWISYFLLYEN